MCEPNYNNSFQIIKQIIKCLNNGIVGSSVATAMELPVVHFQIINELVMSPGILNLSTRLKESFNAIKIAPRLHSGACIVIEAEQI
jgi:hypothetical protein